MRLLLLIGVILAVVATTVLVSCDSASDEPLRERVPDVSLPSERTANLHVQQPDACRTAVPERFPSDAVAAEFSDALAQRGEAAAARVAHDAFIQFLNASSGPALQFAVVALTSERCPGCTAFKPAFALALRNVTCDAPGGGAAPRVRFVWVDCARVEHFPRLFCFSNSVTPGDVEVAAHRSAHAHKDGGDATAYPPRLFHSFEQYPSVCMFSASPTAVRRLDGSDGLKPAINVLTGKPVADEIVRRLQSTEQSQQQQQQGGEGDEDDDEDSSGFTRWNLERLIHRVRAVAFGSVVKNVTVAAPDVQASRDDAFAKIFDEFSEQTSAGNASWEEPGVTVLAFVPGAAGGSAESGGDDDDVQCGGMTDFITAEERVLSPDAAATERSQVHCVSVSGLPIRRRSVCDARSGSGADGANNAALTAFHEAAAYFSIDAGQQRRFFLARDQATIASLMVAALSNEHNFSIDGGDGGRFAASYIAEYSHSADTLLEPYEVEYQQQKLKEDLELLNSKIAAGSSTPPATKLPCQFLSRPVLAIFRCADISVQRGRCVRYAVRFRELPGDGAALIDALVDGGRPAVSVVSNGDSDRTFPGDILKGLASASSVAGTGAAVDLASLPLVASLAQLPSFEDDNHRDDHHGHLPLSDRGAAQHVHGHHHNDHSHLHERAARNLQHTPHEHHVASAKLSGNSNNHRYYVRPPPVFALFVETQSCKGRPSQFWDAVHMLRPLAAEYGNVTFAIYDSLRYSELYLRSGLTRPLVDKLRLGMAIIDGGGKHFSVVAALEARNWTRDERLLDYALGRKKMQGVQLDFNGDVARLLLQSFWAGRLRPIGKVRATDRDDELGGGAMLAEERRMRLKSATQVLQFFGAPPRNAAVAAEPAFWWSRPGASTTRVLLVEAPHKAFSLDLKRAVAALSLSAAAASAAEAPFAFVFALVNGEGRGALASELLWPERRRSDAPFFICATAHERDDASLHADVKRQEEHGQQQSQQQVHRRRLFVSAPKFATFSRSAMDTFQALNTTAREEQLVEWLKSACA